MHCACIIWLCKHEAVKEFVAGFIGPVQPVVYNWEIFVVGMVALMYNLVVEYAWRMGHAMKCESQLHSVLDVMTSTGSIILKPCQHAIGSLLLHIYGYFM